MKMQHADGYEQVIGSPTRWVWYRSYTTEHAEVKLATGGPLGSKRLNLWCITVEAANVITGLKIPPEKIEVGGVGKLGSDGRRWVVLPDSDTVTITPRANGSEYYSYTVTAQKHNLSICANGIDLSRTNAEFCVGQNISLEARFTPPVPSVQSVVGLWSLSGKFVNSNWQATVWLPPGDPLGIDVPIGSTQSIVICYKSTLISKRLSLIAVQPTTLGGSTAESSLQPLESLSS
jgi:hypothetical protein